MTSLIDKIGKTKNVQLILAVIVVGAMAAIGTLVSKAGHAQSPYIAVSACSGSLSGGASCQTDTTASGNQAVTFGGSSSTSSSGGVANCPEQSVGGPNTCIVNPYLFDDEFNGSASPISSDPNWYVFTGCQLGGSACNDLASNASIDGQGHLDLRITPNGDGTYSGAFIGTFNYVSGWPPNGTHGIELMPPYHIEMSAEIPYTNSNWSGLWVMDVNRTAVQGNIEMDVSEEYGTDSQAQCNQHYWENEGSGFVDTMTWHCPNPISDPAIATSYNTYAADVYSDHVVYYFNGQVLGTSSTGEQGDGGILLDTDLLSTPTDGTGPWDLRIDYIRVTPLGTIEVH